MLNAKAQAAVELADAAEAGERLDNECGCTEEPCPDCKEAMARFEGALAKYKAIEGEAGEVREPVQNRRSGYNLKASAAGHKVYLRTSNYPDGRLAEIFVDCNRAGATLRGVFTSFAIAVSLGLQHGVPLQEFVDAFVGSKFEPLGKVHYDEPDEEAIMVAVCTSLVDLIFQDLALNYGSAMPTDGAIGQVLSV